jgi:hypothetical protein
MGFRLFQKVGDYIGVSCGDVDALTRILGKVEQQRRVVLGARLALAVRAARDEMRLNASLRIARSSLSR